GDLAVEGDGAAVGDDDERVGVDALVAVEALTDVGGEASDRVGGGAEGQGRVGLLLAVTLIDLLGPGLLLGALVAELGRVLLALAVARPAAVAVADVEDAADAVDRVLAVGRVLTIA